MQRTLSNGRRSGFISGLGAASVDAVYGSIAGFGFTALSATLLAHRTGIHLGGGLLLVYLGVRSFRAEPAALPTAAAEHTVSTNSPEPSTANVSPSGRRTLVREYGSTFLLTITNPMTLLAFIGIFTGLGIGTSGEYLDAVALVGGVFLGSALWWFALSTCVSRFRTRFSRSLMHRVNQLAGVVIVGFGLVALWSGL
ncbi:LysE family translocator [Haladaptatus sp. CMAA 1911]|uniref:LysE family translocator n=1 Tax=Haladaptatus sp. CMAA 1911 TaxID=3368987 RepID=UPI0037553397